MARQTKRHAKTVHPGVAAEHVPDVMEDVKIDWFLEQQRTGWGAANTPAAARNRRGLAALLRFR
jgi:hypothetical protein